MTVNQVESFHGTNSFEKVTVDNSSLDSAYCSYNSHLQSRELNSRTFEPCPTDQHYNLSQIAEEQSTQSVSDLSDNMETADKDSADTTKWRVEFDDFVGENGAAADVEKFVESMPSTQQKNAAETLWEKRDGCDNWFALYFALASNNLMVRLAVAVAKSDEMLNTRNKYNQTLLHVAAATCDAATVRYLYCKGGDLKHKDAWGNSPLHIAAQLGRADVLRALTKSPQSHEQQHPRFGVRFRACQRKEDLNFINNDGKAPIHLAAEGNHVEALQVLAELKNVVVDLRRYTDGYSPAHIAVEQGSMELLTVCVQNKSDSENRNCNGETPQQLAHVCHRQDMVTLCQEHGASYHQLEFAATDSIYEMQRENVEYMNSQMECMVLESPMD